MPGGNQVSNVVPLQQAPVGKDKLRYVDAWDQNQEDAIEATDSFLGLNRLFQRPPHQLLALVERNNRNMLKDLELDEYPDTFIRRIS